MTDERFITPQFHVPQPFAYNCTQQLKLRKRCAFVIVILYSRWIDANFLALYYLELQIIRMPTSDGLALHKVE